MSELQTYANHRRYHPPFHFFVFPILAVNVAIAVAFLYKRPGWLTVWNLFFALALVMLALLTRVYALRVQDRLIRLEETLRLSRVLPEDLRGRIGELSGGDLIGLRFCADEELPELVRAVYAGECRGREAIKKRIRNWRPDTHRI